MYIYILYHVPKLENNGDHGDMPAKMGMNAISW